MSRGGRNWDPSVHRRRLGKVVRDAREAAGLTQRDAYTAMEWSVSKLLRIEAGSSTITANDLRALLGLYRLGEEDIERLVEVARAAKGVSRWNVYRDVASSEYLTFVGCESSAAIIRNFEPQLIPGLLQTEEYARAVISITESENPERIEPLVDLRTERQDVLFANPPELHFILDEAVIRRVVGSPAVTRQQLRKLLELATEPNVNIRIVPFSVGLYPTLRSPYVLFEFDDDYETTLYVEGSLGTYISREPWTNSRERLASGPAEIFLAEFWRLEHLTNGVNHVGMIKEALSALD